MAINTANLVSYWKADRAGEFKDSKSTNHGTINGATYTVDGKIGGAYSFDGTNDNVKITAPTGIEGNQTFTLSYWVEPASGGYSWSYGRQATTPYTGWLLGQPSATNLTLFAGKTTSPGYINIVLTSVLPSTGLNHVVVTFNNGTIDIYVNGASVHSSTGNGAILYGTYTDLAFGADASTNTLFYGGTIDEAAYWNTALSASEITELYNSGTGKTYNPDTNEFEAPDTLVNGLVSYWNFDTDATDIVSGNNGTVTGATLADGKISKGYGFDGVNDKIVLDSYTGINTDKGSVFMWIKTTGTVGYDLFTKSRTTNNYDYCRLNLNNGELQTYAELGGSQVYTTNGAGLSDGNWHHVGFVSDGTNPIKFYVDGVEFTTTTQTAGSINNCWFSDVGTYADDVFTFGVLNRPSITGWYDGKIDEPAIWNRALTSTEITDLYNSGTGKTYDIGKNAFIDGDALKVGQVSYWKFDDNATTVKDAHSISDGTVTGATYTATGKINGAYSFDGTNDYVTTPNNTAISGTNNWTINLWVKLNDVVSNQVFIGTQDGSVYSQGWVVVFGSGALIFVFDTNTSSPWEIILTSSRTWTTNWTMVTLTRTGSTFQYYFDGVPENSGTSSASMSNSDPYISFGGISGTARWLDGLIDEPAIWNRALTSTEITELYNSGTGLQYPYEVLGPIGYTNSVNGVVTYTSINGILATAIVSINGV